MAAWVCRAGNLINAVSCIKPRHHRRELKNCQKSRDLKLGEHVRALFLAIGHRPKAGDVVHVYRDDVRPWLEDEVLCPDRNAAVCATCGHFAERARQPGNHASRDEALGRFVRAELFYANDPTLERTVVTVGAAQISNWL